MVTKAKSIRIVNPTVLELVKQHAKPQEKTATGVAERLIIRGALAEAAKREEHDAEIVVDTVQHGSPVKRAGSNHTALSAQ
jgi:hypothetical protein